MHEKIFFKDNAGNKVAGILSYPDAKKDCIVILCHGLVTSKESTTGIRLEKILNEEGIATLRFDFYAHGESEGRPEDMTLEHWIQDIIGACSYAKKKGFSKIGLFASSFSCPAAVIAAAGRQDIALLALKSPGMGTTSRKMTLLKKDFEQGTWFPAGKRVRAPTLIVHGDADTEVELNQAKRLADAIPGARLEVIEGADHSYSEPDDFERMLQLISGFIIARMHA